MAVIYPPESPGSNSGTPNLNFLNTEYKADGKGCRTVSVSTPTTGFTYLDYIFDNKSKDFKDIKKYAITYSKDCQNEATIDIAPDYVFSLTKLSCTNSGGNNTYVVQLNGINGNLVADFKFGTPTASAHLFTNTLGVITFILQVGQTISPISYQMEVTTTAGFVYLSTFTIIQDITKTCGWDGTLSVALVTTITNPSPNPPNLIVEYGSGQLNLNSLFVSTTLPPALYKIKICEVDYNDNEICLEGQQFIDCHSTPCVDAGLCDPTEDVCNVTLEAKKQHEAMIYGLDCCNEAKRNLLTHYIRIYCSDEVTCL